MSLSKIYGTKLPTKLEKKFLKYCRREGLSPSRALAKAIDAVVGQSPNRQWYLDQMVHTVAEVMRAQGVASAEELRKSLSREVGGDLAKRVEKAVAKAIASLDGGMARFKASAISGYVPDPADERPNGGYLSGEGQDSAGESNFDSGPDNDESRDSGWQSDDEDGSVPAHGAPMTKTSRALLRTLGVDTEPKRKLRKSADANRTQSFTLSSEVTPEKSAPYKTSADYATGERLPAPLKVAGQLMEAELLNKRLTAEGGRTPEALDQLGKAIGAGSGADGDEYTKAVAAMFGTVKKA